MADRIKANTERMKQDVDNIIALVQQMEYDYQKLSQEKIALDRMWDGPASEAFKKVFDDDLVVLQAMINNLKKIHIYENMAKECYHTCETQIEGVISDI